MSLRLFSQLVETRHGLEEATAAAQQGVSSSEGDIQTSALRLFSRLVEKGQALEAATAAANQGIEAGHFMIQEEARALLAAVKIGEEKRSNPAMNL